MSCVICHMSCVTCHMSHVTCHMSCVAIIFSFLFRTKWWSLLVEGLLSTGSTPSSFLIYLRKMAEVNSKVAFHQYATILLALICSVHCRNILLLIWLENPSAINRCCLFRHLFTVVSMSWISVIRPFFYSRISNPHLIFVVRATTKTKTVLKQAWTEV